MAASDDRPTPPEPAYRPPDALDSATVEHHRATTPPHRADAALHAEGERLGGRTTVEGRIDALQGQLQALEAHVASSQRHWYRDAASLVAVLALVFSFGTTFVSLDRAAQQERHDKKAELLGLIDRLSAITRDYADAQSRYANDPGTLSTLSSVLTQQQLLAAEQAASIMAEIPGDVNAAEYVFVANILVSSSLDDPGLHLLDLGIEHATNANDLVGALRSKAVREFQIGKLDEGRALFRRSLDVFTNFKNDSASYVAYTHLQTQQVWTTAELYAGQCAEARIHLEAARQYVAQFDSRDSRVQQIAALGPLVAACKPGATAQPSGPAQIPVPSAT